MKLLAFLVCIACLSIPVSAASFSPSDIEWGTAVPGTLHKNDTVTNGVYTVKAVQFPSPVTGRQDIYGNWIPETDVDPMVYLEVYKDDVLIQELIMTPQSEPYIDPDYEVKVSATGFMAKNAKEWIYQFYDPWATVSVQTRAKPSLEVTVTTDKSSYTSSDDSIITATVTVKNSGQAFLKNVDVALDTGELKLRGGSTSQLHQYYYRMEKGTSQSFAVILLVPYVSSEKSYSLRADAKGCDVKELEYRSNNTVQITVSPKPVKQRITVSKAVKNNIYLKNSALVTISVSNGGEYDAYNVTVNDSMNENFILNSNTTLHWEIPILKAGKEWSTTYSIKPTAASLEGFTIPAATAQFTFNNKRYTVSSDTNTVVVNGPKIVLNKTVDRSTVNISENVTVTLSINNVGNIITKARVNDSLPDGAVLVSGQTFIPSVPLELNKPQEFRYIIRMNREGEIQLPAAVAEYTDIAYRGITLSAVQSSRPNITVIDPSKIPPPLPAGRNPPPQETAAQHRSLSPAEASEPASTPVTPGCGVMTAVIVFIITAVYIRNAR